jgi:hypothetical protein
MFHSHIVPIIHANIAVELQPALEGHPPHLPLLDPAESGLYDWVSLRIVGEQPARTPPRKPAHQQRPRSEARLNVVPPALRQHRSEQFVVAAAAERVAPGSEPSRQTETEVPPHDVAVAATITQR